MENWYTKLLSPAGKEVLIKSVVTVLPTYSMSCFLLPVKIIKQMVAATRKFLWSSRKDRGKILWISWNKIIKSKDQGGLGIRDFKDFNIALLTKQSWRIMQNPSSLLARVYKAKYYAKTTLLQATKKWSSSYAWKGILQENKLLKHGIKWVVGNGEHIQAWKDQWLPIKPSLPLTGVGASLFPYMRVKDFFIPGTTIWDDVKLRSLCCPLDIPLVHMIRPSLAGVFDMVTWAHTKHGEYTLKSGYHLLQSQKCQTSSTPTHIYKTIWKENVPPKVKHLWWRAFHEALPVTLNLRHKHILENSSCPVCGETDESVNHLLFTCRISREIWDLAPLL